MDQADRLAAHVDRRPEETAGTGTLPWMHAVPELVLIALAVTLAPGPATAMILRVAARDGRRAALSAIVGNSAGVLMWGCLSAVGVSSLILASEVAYDGLRIGGAAVLIIIGLRSLLGGGTLDDVTATGGGARGRTRVARAGWRIGLITSVSNPKLAVFFVALFPQFIEPNQPVLPAAMAMALLIVMFDLAWYSSLAYAVDRAGSLLKPRVRRVMERITGVVLVGLGVRLATEAH